MLGELVVLVSVSVTMLGDDSDVNNDIDDDGSDDVGGGGGVIALFIVADLCVVICCNHDAHSCRVAAVNDSYGAATDFCVSPSPCDCSRDVFSRAKTLFHRSSK